MPNLTADQLTDLAQWRAENDNLSDNAFLDLANSATIEKHRPVSSTDVAAHIQATVSHKSEFGPQGQPLKLLSLYNVLSLTYRDDSFEPHVRAHAENAIDLGTSESRLLALHDNPLYAIMLSSIVGAGQWTQAEADGVLNLGRYYVSEAEERYGEGASLTLTDINAAELLPTRNALNLLIAELEARRGDAENGTSPDLTAAQTMLSELAGGDN